MLATHVEQWAQKLEYRGEQRGLQIGEQRGLQIGEQKGLRDGEARTLLHLIERRFGPAPDWARANLATADLDTLDLWTTRILDAKSLEDIFQ
ncbi:MAG: hypothetical protein HQL82_14660 [Magnetococcales bacterium]|nr:hypothetical protein [Magnetococcales bacterium]